MALTPVQELRTLVGDNNLEFQLLPDETYDYLLGPTRFKGNVRRAALAAVPLLLFEVARFPTRERTGSIEVWNDWANAYRRALELFLKDPNLNPVLGSAMPYAGGIDKGDMVANRLDDNNVSHPVYRGMSSAEDELEGGTGTYVAVARMIHEHVLAENAHSQYLLRTDAEQFVTEDELASAEIDEGFFGEGLP